MTVIFIIHGALVVVLLRAKPQYLTAPAPALLATIFFITPEPRRVLLPSISSRVAPRSLGMEPIPAVSPESSAITI